MYARYPRYTAAEMLSWHPHERTLDMHFCCLVILPPFAVPPRTNAEAEEAVQNLLTPWSETGHQDTEYDWYQIGGRFTGALDDYDPTTDPLNREVCEWCEGTGTTTEKVAREFPAYLRNVGKQCYQCDGTGEMVKFSFVWHAGDVQRVNDLPSGWDNCYAVCDGVNFIKRERFAYNTHRGEGEWLPNPDWPVPLRERYGDRYCVVVDYHN